jgi:hypothetical protein
LHGRCLHRTSCLWNSSQFHLAPRLKSVIRSRHLTAACNSQLLTRAQPASSPFCTQRRAFSLGRIMLRRKPPPPVATNIPTTTVVTDGNLKTADAI